MLCGWWFEDFEVIFHRFLCDLKHFREGGWRCPFLPVCQSILRSLTLLHYPLISTSAIALLQRMSDDRNSVFLGNCAGFRTGKNLYEGKTKSFESVIKFWWILRGYTKPNGGFTVTLLFSGKVFMDIWLDVYTTVSTQINLLEMFGLWSL
jgi:hypothetical protein